MSKLDLEMHENWLFLDNFNRQISSDILGTRWWVLSDSNVPLAKSGSQRSSRYELELSTKPSWIIQSQWRS